MRSQGSAWSAENLRHGAIGAVAVLTFVLGGMWLVDAAGVGFGPALTGLAAFLGVQPSDSPRLGMLAFLLFTVPILVLGAAAFIGLTRADRTPAKVVFGSIGVVVLLEHRFGEYYVLDALPPEADRAFQTASLASLGLLAAIAAIWYLIERRSLNEHAAIFIEQDRLEGRQPR